MPQDKTVKSWCFASIGNVLYQWKNEIFSLKVLLKLLSGLPDMDTDFFFWFSLKFTPCLSLSIAFSSILLSKLLFCNLCYPLPGSRISTFRTLFTSCSMSVHPFPNSPFLSCCLWYIFLNISLFSGRFFHLMVKFSARYHHGSELRKHRIIA